MDTPTSKRPIYSRSSYPSVPLLSLIVSPASEQRPKSLVRSELSTSSCILDAGMSDRVLLLTLPFVQSLALSLVNLVTCLISIIFECFQYIFQVFSMRGSRERDQVYCFIVSGCFQWARMRAGYANRKRCIIVDAEYRHRPSEVPRRSARVCVRGRNIFFLFIHPFFFSTSALPFSTLTLAPSVFHRIHGADSV